MYSLTAKQRNFKKPGAKLRPRDAYTAGCIAPNGYRNSAECKRAWAAEHKAMGGWEGMRPSLSRSEKRVIKLKKGMSGRAIKRVHRALGWYETMPKQYHAFVLENCRNMKRLYNYMTDVRMEAEIKAIDARMLRNAY